MGIDIIEKSTELTNEEFIFEAQGYLNHPKSAITLATRCLGSDKHLCVYHALRLTGRPPCRFEDGKSRRVLTLFEHYNGTHWDGCKYGGGLGGISVANKRMALVIAVLALFLAFAETAVKSAQTTALNAQIEASNLWNFFQAKNVRRSSNVIAAEQATLNLTGITDPNQRAATEKQIAEWTATAERYRSEPSAADGKGEGTEELRVRAVESEHLRDEMLAKDHNYEFASAGFQVGIVLASAAVITGLIGPGFLAGGLAFLIGLAFMAFGMFAPHLLHLH